MVRLYLVGFTTDLKSLIFATRRGAKSGTYLVGVDERLRQTLREVDRLAEEAKSGQPVALLVGGESAAEQADGAEAAAPPRHSRLTPREIQSMLRQGKSVEEVARLAETDVSWIERFTGPVFGERAVIVEAVKSAWITKPRLGRSGVSVGEAIMRNLRDKRIRIPPEILDKGWDAVRRDGQWEVTFRYLSRGQRKEASFSLDPETKQVRPTNLLAAQIGWRAPTTPGVAEAAPVERPRPRKRRTAAKRSAKPAASTEPVEAASQASAAAAPAAPAARRRPRSRPRSAPSQ